MDWQKRVELKSYTASTLSTQKSLLENLTLTRKKGFAVDLAEGLEGIHCIAAPILNEYEYPVAALTIMSPSFRLPPEQFDQLGSACVLASEKIQQRLFT
jgi:IclR family acetate operon transcriptional repressor